MTLTISHDGFCGMCSEFHDWRCAVAVAAGFVVDDGSNGNLKIGLDWDTITDDNIAGVWTVPADEPLLVVFAHSDIEGRIYPPDAVRLADRLGALPMPKEWQAITQKFVTGCRLAASRIEPMEFTYDMAATIRRLIEDHLRKEMTVSGPSRCVVRVPEWLNTPAA